MSAVFPVVARGFFVRNALLVELIAQRDVFLRHDRFSRSILSKHFGSLTFLSDCQTGPIIWICATWLAHLRSIHSTAPRSKSGHVTAAGHGIAHHRAAFINCPFACECHPSSATFVALQLSLAHSRNRPRWGRHIRANRRSATAVRQL